MYEVYEMYAELLGTVQYTDTPSLCSLCGLLCYCSISSVSCLLSLLACLLLYVLCLLLPSYISPAPTPSPVCSRTAFSLLLLVPAALPVLCMLTLSIMSALLCSSCYSLCMCLLCLLCPPAVLPLMCSLRLCACYPLLLCPLVPSCRPAVAPTVLPSNRAAWPGGLAEHPY